MRHSPCGIKQDRVLRCGTTRDVTRMIDTCSTLYTNVHRRRKRGSVAVSAEGLNNYDDNLQFSGKLLHRDPHYDVFRRICNAKAKKLGLLKNCRRTWWHSEEDEKSDCDDGEGEVPCFDVDDGLILAIFPILLGFRCHMSYNICVKFIKYGDLQILRYMLRISSVDCCIWEPGTA